MLFQSFSLPTYFTITFSATKNNKLFSIKFYSTIYNKYITHAVKLREAGLAAPGIVINYWFLANQLHIAIGALTSRDRVDIMEKCRHFCISVTVFCLFQHHFRHTKGIK